MKKILSNISTDDIDDYTLLLQNIDSYKTLLLIKRNNGSLSENVEKDILERKKECEKNLNTWWEKITLKYNIPFYLDKKMHIDAQRLQIYVNE